VFSSVNITVARPKLKISRKFSCRMARGGSGLWMGISLGHGRWR
jgi:hypothetical protein